MGDPVQQERGRLLLPRKRGCSPEPATSTSGWLALLAARATPKPILARLHQELDAAAADPLVHAKIIEQGAEPAVTSPEELAEFIAAETVKWRGIITKAGIPAIQ